MSKDFPGPVLPPGLLRPDFAREGKVVVVIELAVPVPPDPSLPLRLADVLADADLVDCFAVNDGEPYGGEEVRPAAVAPAWQTVREWQGKHAGSEEGGQQ